MRQTQHYIAALFHQKKLSIVQALGLGAPPLKFQSDGNEPK